MAHPAFKAGSVAVITGAADGIGLAWAKTLLQKGLKVVISDIDEGKLKTVKEQELKNSNDVLAVKADVSKLSDVESLRDQALKKFDGKVDALFLNAGTSQSSSTYGDDLAAWHKIVDTNLWGVVNGMHAFVPSMLKTRKDGTAERGTIVVTGSKQGITCPPGNPAYNVSKAAVKAATEALTHQLRNDGDHISVHLVVPGFTYTGLTKKMLGDGPKPDEAWEAQQVVDYALERIAPPKEQFYIICPDNTVTEELDNARMQWSLGDVIEKRPPLSRWHPDYKEQFEAHIKKQTGK